jgi:hypothetical protein
LKGWNDVDEVAANQELLDRRASRKMVFKDYYFDPKVLASDRNNPHSGTQAQTEQEKFLEDDINDIENFYKYREEGKELRNTEKGRQGDAITEAES